MLGGSVGAATPLSVFEPVAPSLRLAETRPEFGASGFTRLLMPSAPEAPLPD